MLADESLYVRSAILGRLRQASYGGDMAAMAALSLGGPQVAFADGEPDQRARLRRKSPSSAGEGAAPAPRDAATSCSGRRASAPGAASTATATPRPCGAISPASSPASTRASAATDALGIAAGYTGSRNALDGRGSAECRDRTHCGLRRLELRRVQPARRRRLRVPLDRHRPHDRVPGLLRPRFRATTTATPDRCSASSATALRSAMSRSSRSRAPPGCASQTDAAAERGGLAALNVARHDVRDRLRDARHPRGEHRPAWRTTWC